MSRSAILTVVTGKAAEGLDRTFESFKRCSGVPLHAIILGERLPSRQLPGIEYRLERTTSEFAHPLREVYFRRLELIDTLDADFVLTVDAYDVLCMQELPEFDKLLGGAALAASVEHSRGGRPILGQGFTAAFLNAGVVFWDVNKSRGIREEVVRRGRSQFRSIVDDQDCLNEVVQTKYYDLLRILPPHYNYRCFLLPRRCLGWPSVSHLHGVMIYHNGYCIEAAKAMLPVKPRAELPPLAADRLPLGPRQKLWRRLQARFSLWFRF